MSETRSEEHLPPGTKVEVRQRFDNGWVHGFEVAGAEHDGYRLRRLSDRAILPISFPRSDVRTAR